MPKSKKTIPIYEYAEKVNGQTRYYIRPYIDEKQVTKRLDENGKMWLGRDGYNNACEAINTFQKQIIENNLKKLEEEEEEKKIIYYQQLKECYLEEAIQFLKEQSYCSYLEVIKNQIEPFFSADEHSIINRENVLKWHEQMQKKEYSVSYKNKCHTVLCNMLDVGTRQLGIESNYEHSFGQFKENKNITHSVEEKIRYITKEEFDTFIDKVDDKLWYTVFYTLYYSGMRKGELMALTWEDICFKTKKIKINKTYTDRVLNDSYKMTSTKNFKTRYVDMNEKLAKTLLEWYLYIKQEEEFNSKNLVFGQTKPISTTTMTNRKNKYFKEAGIPAITIHEFRHSHVSLVINEGIKRNFDMNKIFLMLADRMGHTLQVMQEVYMHLFSDVQTDLVSLLNDL